MTSIVDSNYERPCQMSSDDLAQVSDPSLDHLSEELARRTEQRKRAECMAAIQTHTVQLALDLIVREADISGFFRAFMKSLIDMSESQACGVWLLDEQEQRVDLWMCNIADRFLTAGVEGWETLALPRAAMSSVLLDNRDGWAGTVEYGVDDPRLPEAVREFNRASGLATMAIAPLALPSHVLGWIVLATGDAPAEHAPWRRALLEATAKQATLALHQNRLAEQSQAEVRRQAVLEERNRIARDIHDNLAQGFAAILMQLQSVQRVLPTMASAAARSIETAIDLARTHMVEARRSVGALRPQDVMVGDVAAVLERTADLARRTTDVPIEVVIDELPPLGSGVESEIVSIAQEALTNAIRHARAKRIILHATNTRSVGLRLSVADDGRGIANDRFGTGFGLTSMQERADRIGGSLTIVTAPRAGTEVVLAWEPPPFSVPAT